MSPADLRALLVEVLSEAGPVSARQRSRRGRAPGCGRALGPESLVSAAEIALETGHGEAAISELLRKRKHRIEHTAAPHGAGGQVYRWLWREARAVVIRELGGGGLVEATEGRPTRLRAVKRAPGL